VIDITSYHTDLARQIESAVKARMEVMRPPHPSWTAVGTTALAAPDGVTEIRVVAKLPAKN
jgi:enamine deaminase RidA (YjgF/YER057c/UK114 family)